MSSDTKEVLLLKTFHKVEGQWIVPETTELFGLIIMPGASLEAPEGKTLVMTVNGESVAPAPGNYEGDIVLEVLDPIPNGNYQFRAAIYAEGGAVIEEKSALSAVLDGEVKDGECIDVSITSRDENFNGICVGGKGPYTVSGADVSLMGNGGNDFIGYGAGIMSGDDAVLTVEDSYITTKGAARGALFAGGNSKLYVKNCEISAEDGVLPYDYEDNVMPGNMRRVPWMLGLRGNCRATNLADYADALYEDCTITSEGWGVMSTDGVRRCRLTLKNCDVAVTGPSGYGAFSIGDCIDTFEDCRIDVPDYALIMANETASGTFKNTKVDAGRFAVMCFRNEGGKLVITDGSVMNTDETTVVVKGCAPIIEADNCVLSPGNGIILQVMNSDDPGNPAGYYIDPKEDDVPDPEHDNKAARETYDVIATFKDMTVTGDFYNGSTGKKGDTGPKMVMAPPPGAGPEGPGGPGGPGGGPGSKGNGYDGVRNMALTFDNAAVTGIISASKALHRVEKVFKDNCEELGEVVNTAQPVVNNGVIVALKNGAVWTVAGTSYLSSLTIDETSKVIGTLLVDGKETEPVPGTYTGALTLTL